MANVMTLQEFTEAYKKQNPHDRVATPKAISNQWGTLVPMFIGLFAANILSAFHTGPLIARTFATMLYTPENVFMASMGVLAVEFVVFIIMFVSWEKAGGKEKFLRVSVIAIAIAVSAIANVNATMLNLGTTDSASAIAGGLVGIFAPLANLSLAEVLRLVLSRTKQERDLVAGDYHAALKAWDVQMRTRYANYLKRYGITDATAVMKLSSGEKYEPELSPQSTTEPVVGQERHAITEKQAAPPRIVDLASKLKANGDVGLSYKAIESKYGVGPSDISKAKKYIQQ